MKTDVENLVKTGEGTFVFNDDVAFQQYKKQRSAMSKTSNLESEINTLKAEIHDIKSLLLQLVKDRT